MAVFGRPSCSGLQVWTHRCGSHGNVHSRYSPPRCNTSSLHRFSRVGRNSVKSYLSWTASACSARTRGPPSNFAREESDRRSTMSASNPNLLESVCSESGSRRDEGFDVLLLSNGPGEVATWVKPVVAALRACSSQRVSPFRISVVLAPCPHASGAELELLNSYKEVDRCQGPESFWKLLLLGSTKDGWKWHKRGVCIFLGGDQAYALLLGLRFGYKAIIYAEDAVRWPGIAHKYMLRSEELLRQVPSWAKSSCAVVGDLFSDAVLNSQKVFADTEFSASSLTSTLTSCNPRAGVPLNEGESFVPVVGLLPGSKGSKLALGVPYLMAAAGHLYKLLNGRVRFILPLAPTATLDMLESQANIDSNPFILRFGWSSGFVTRNPSVKMKGGFNLGTRNAGERDLVRGEVGYLTTSGGVQIEVWQEFPSHDLFKICKLCLTTIGTNTAELGLLGIPMLVLLPTHATEVFRGGTGGLLGLLAKQPGRVGKSIAQAVNLAILKAAGYLAWPNRWAREEIVPELVGRIEPNEVAAIAAYYLTCEEKLLAMRERLFDVCARHRFKGEVLGSEVVTRRSAGGAAEAIAAEVTELASF